MFSKKYSSPQRRGDAEKYKLILKIFSALRRLRGNLIFPVFINPQLKSQTALRHHSSQSAMKMSVSRGFCELRFDPKTIFFPSGENMGKLSNTLLKVTRSRPVPSM